ncbi:MAG: RNA methyltransferase [Paludibacteraceae bacterium]|nr:RNA methyltransferase [Paludibacteraceae bacterium]
MQHVSKAQIKLVRSLQQKKFRDETGLFVAEGEKCVEELMKGFELYLLVNRDNATEREIEQMSGLRTPQGTIGVFRKKLRVESLELREVESGELKVIPVLALDGVQDPGNLGTIIRTADWFGISDIVCSRDTADCYNPKVVQATMGSLARVRIHYSDLENWLAGQSAEGNIPIYGTLLEGRNIYKEKLEKKAIIVMGNEGNGISDEVRRLVTHPVSIPPFRQGDHAESLNVAIATAITLSEFLR